MAASFFNSILEELWLALSQPQSASYARGS